MCVCVCAVEGVGALSLAAQIGATEIPLGEEIRGEKRGGASIPVISPHSLFHQDRT